MDIETAIKKFEIRRKQKIDSFEKNCIEWIKQLSIIQKSFCFESIYSHAFKKCFSEDYLRSKIKECKNNLIDFVYSMGGKYKKMILNWVFEEWENEQNKPQNKIPLDALEEFKKHSIDFIEKFHWINCSFYCPFAICDYKKNESDFQITNRNMLKDDIEELEKEIDLKRFLLDSFKKLLDMDREMLENMRQEKDRILI